MRCMFSMTGSIHSLVNSWHVCLSKAAQLQGSVSYLHNMFIYFLHPHTLGSPANTSGVCLPAVEGKAVGRGEAAAGGERVKQPHLALLYFGSRCLFLPLPQCLHPTPPTSPPLHICRPMVPVPFYSLPPTACPSSAALPLGLLSALLAPLLSSLLSVPPPQLTFSCIFGSSPTPARGTE